MTKLLRMAILISVVPVLAFGQRGGGSRGGGGGARSGGGMRSSGGSVSRGGGSFGGGSISRGGSSGFRGGNTVFRGGNTVFRGGNTVFRGGNTVFRGGNTFLRGSRFVGGRFFYPYSFYYPSFYLGLGYGGYPYYDPYYYGSYYGAPYYSDPYVYGAPYDNTVGYAQGTYAQPQAPTVINQSIGTESGGTTSPGGYYRAADYYLIAFNDHTIQAALSYRVEGDEIHYTTREHEERTAPLSSVDRMFSEQINRDRRVEFRLP
jgi:hypothetical protein